MRKILINEEEVMFVGNAKDIKSLYKALNRGYKKGSCDWAPLYLDSPRFNPYKFYGLLLDEEGCYFHVISEHTALALTLGLDI